MNLNSESRETQPKQLGPIHGGADTQAGLKGPAASVKSRLATLPGEASDEIQGGKKSLLSEGAGLGKGLEMKEVGPLGTPKIYRTSPEERGKADGLELLR